jgi:drug/metabolite transporter (DMT)-like permease
MSLADSPILLLLCTGGLLGAAFPLGKMAAEAGVAAAVWAFLISAGSASALLTVLAVTGRRLGGSGRHLRYYLTSGVISYAVPNLLLFTVIPHLGAGLASIMFTLSPIVTLVLATVLRLRRPTLLGSVGIAVGFLGAILIVQSKGEIGRPAEPLWLGLAIVVPVALAVGNIYRTVDWPPGADGLELAAGTNLASALVLGLVGPALLGTFPVEGVLNVPLLAFAQVAASAVMFVMFFRLQAVGGPVYLSQIGYVGAAVGLASGSLMLGERYGGLTWSGGAVIAAGVAMTTLAQRRGSRP